MIVERIKIADIDEKENSRGMADKNMHILMDSIQQDGLLEPIGVNREKSGRYSVMYGNRRLSACTKLGWKSIPAVLHVEQDQKSFLIKNLLENVQRDNLTPVEVGRICEELEKLGMNTKEMALRLCMPASTIASVLEVYRGLSPELRKKVVFHKRGMKKNGALSVSNVEKILKIRTTLGLTSKKATKLLDYTGLHELSNEDIKVLTWLLDTGLTLDQALLQREKYKVYRVDVPANIEEVESLGKPVNLTPINYITSVVYGLNSPISKPNFLKLGDRRERSFKGKV